MKDDPKSSESEGAAAEDLDLPADQSEQVKGGRAPVDVVKKPVPGGPVPIPYPNFTDG
jgi:hypothetical protein